MITSPAAPARTYATASDIRLRVPPLHPSTRLAQRAGEIAPFVLSMFIASSVFWAPLTSFTASLFAFSITAFFVYWLVRSYAVAVACAVGLRRIRRWEATHWPERYARWAASTAGAQAWEWPRHMVIIPNYKEAEEGLARTLGSLAAQDNAEQVVVVLAMEAREDGAREKADRLIERFSGHFAEMFATYHPAGIPGEAPGKGSNEAWAAREAHTRLIVDGHQPIERYSVTSCDADAVFHPRHFSALNYLFLTARDRYRTFWQPTIFNSNNIWEIPVALRIPDGLSGINRTANMVLPFSIKFPTSCYALSWSMLHAIDYWDEEVIPEDWHVFLKASFTLGDRVHVEGLYLPLGNDCVLTDGTYKTMKAHYEQAKRHAWGVTDVPYAWTAVMQRGPLSKARGIMLASALTKTHVMWVAQWYLVTLGILAPAKMAAAIGAPMPLWWTHKAFAVPGPGWHPENIIHVDNWLAFDRTGLVEPTMWLNFCGLLIAICLLPLISLIIFETKTRPPRPEWISNFALVRQYAMWPLMGPITFFWASMPAMHAQWRLAAGKGLIYKVAEKGSRHLAASPASPPATAAAAPTEAN